MNNTLKIFITILLQVMLINAAWAQKGKKVVVESTYKIEASPDTRNFKLTCWLPQSFKNKQIVDTIIFSEPPLRTISTNGTDYAEFVFADLSQGKELTVRTTMKIYECDLQVLKEKKDSFVAQEQLDSYLKSERHIEVDDELIQQKAYMLKGKTILSTIENTYNFVVRHLQYTRFPEPLGARNALIHKEGDCTEFTDLFVALCRANNIPARRMYGFVINAKGNQRHNWPEAYIDKIGWVPFEVTAGNAQRFDYMKNNYVYTSIVNRDGNAKNISLYHIQYNGEKPMMKSSVVFKNK